MPTVFPGTIDSFTNPTPTTDTVTLPHSTQHANHNDAVLALEAKVGVNASAVTTTHDYKLGEVITTDKAVGKSATQTLTNKTSGTGTIINLGTVANGDMYYGNLTGVQTRVPVGAVGQVLTVAAGIPSWQSLTATNVSYVNDTGVANAYIAILSPALSSYTAGVLVQFKAVNANTTTSTVNVNGLGVQAIRKLGGATALASGDIAAGMIVSLEFDGTNFVMLNPVANAPALIRFGGTGADGVLNVTSGTTTIDLASAASKILNYTSINVSAGATLAFSNPAAGGTVVQLKSQGNVTIAGTINCSSLGSAGGASNNGAGGSATAGTAVDATVLIVGGTMTGGGGAVPVNTGGAGGLAPSSPYAYINTLYSLSSRKVIALLCGTGGGGGQSGSAGNNGNGGRGGGALYIECEGAWNFTGTINTSGAVGGNATQAGAGGGGGAGMLLALYKTLTANSGTHTNNSGAGGTGGTVGNGGGGGGGASALANGGAGATSGGAGTAGTNGGGGGGGSFSGAAGGASSTSALLSLITPNMYFA